MARLKPSNNLPVQITSFVGRGAELHEILALLDKARLVTLVGPGGCGKTRLSLQLAALRQDQFESGACFIDLAALTQSEHVIQTAAATLGVQERTVQSIVGAIGESQALIVLDNCEHLLGACGLLAHSILTNCPKVTIIATSREPLSLPGEVIYRVPSLSMVGPEETSDAQTVGKTESAKLFVERARQRVPAFEIDDENAGWVSEICTRLDGIPLALELAASQVGNLSLPELRDALNDCFRVLSTGSRVALPRQQTLRAAIEWSYDLLHERERRLLSRLSVFAGGFTGAAAQAICGDGDSLRSLLALTDKSLVFTVHSEARTRSRLLDTVRQFARERLLDAGQEAEVAARHRDYFLEMASRAQSESHEDSAGWLARLDADRDNLREAILWSLERDENSQALRMSASLGWFWYQRGYIPEGRDLLAQALAKPCDDPTSTERLDTLYTYAWLTNAQGLNEEAADRFKEMAALALEKEDNLHFAEALNGLGLVAYHRDYGVARGYFEEALEINRSLPDGGRSLANLNNLCLLALSAGEYEDADRYGELIVRTARQKGKRENEAVALFLLAVNAYASGRNERAKDLFQQSERLSRKHGLDQRVLHTLIMQGDFYVDLGEPEIAADLFREALVLSETLKATTVEHQVLTGLATTLTLQGSLPEARLMMEEGLRLCQTVDDRSHLARALESAAVLLFATEQGEQAAQLLGAALKLREEHPGTIHACVLTWRERVSAPIGESLGGPTFDRAFEQGRAMTVDRALGRALSCLAPLAVTL